MVRLCIVVEECIFALLMEGNCKLGEVAYTIVAEKLVEARVFDFKLKEHILDSRVVVHTFYLMVEYIFDPEVEDTFDQWVEGISFLKVMKERIFHHSSREHMVFRVILVVYQTLYLFPQT